MPVEITEVTRRAIADQIIVSQISWSGRLTDNDFLSRLYDLDRMPSNDNRFKNASQDIWQHRVNNPSDWEDDWVFFDSRFNLLHCEDADFLRFLAEILHPAVQTDPEQVDVLRILFNECLAPDGYELYESDGISNRPVYSARRLSQKLPQKLMQEPVDRKIPRPVIYVVGETLGNWYFSHTKLNTLFGQLGAPGDPPPGNCVTKSQNWLFRVNNDPAMDPIGFLGELLLEFMTKELHDSPPWSEAFNRITKVLAKHGLAYDISGKIVTAISSKQTPAVITSPPTRAEPPPFQKFKPSSLRFDVALSFPGEHRETVKAIAESLSQAFPRERIFYDHWYDHELARPDLDVYLQRIYHEQSRLVVVFLCAAYESKEWCGLEWRAVRDLIKKRKTDDIMFVRFDKSPVSGTFSIDGYLDAEHKSPAEIAMAVAKRFALLSSPSPSF
jgi:hypothetical protein